MMGLDIGPKTIEKYSDILTSAKTVLWNGPMGVFENKFFESGTKLIAEKLVQIVLDDSIVIAGGGDTASALRHFKLEEKNLSCFHRWRIFFRTNVRKSIKSNK
jgi:phosphoglycerate kinase